MAVPGPAARAIFREVNDLNKKMSKKELDQLLRDCLHSEFSVDDLSSATDDQMYRALALVVRRILSEKRKKFMAQTLSLIHILLVSTKPWACPSFTAQTPVRT